MFELRDKRLVRTGILKGYVSTPTPSFFSTSNFGGGGTTVSRYLSYSGVLGGSNVNLLLNYYYLNPSFDKGMRFDTRTRKTFKEQGDAHELIRIVKNKIMNKLNSDFPSSTEEVWNPLIMLDNGSGNILRDYIGRGELNVSTIKSAYTDIINEYSEFLVSHRFDIGISMDFAQKNTYKGGEMLDQRYTTVLNEFMSRNNELSRLNVQILMDYRAKTNMYAPLHGNNPNEYVNELNHVIRLEDETGFKFSGFAMGGLGVPRGLEGTAELYKRISEVRSRLEALGDNRPIHILGAAALNNVIPILLAGGDTFDCHSPWRRSNEMKVVVPLLDNDGEVISENKNSFLGFVRLSEVSDLGYDISRAIPDGISDLKSLLEMSKGTAEEQYLSEISLYEISLFQYQRLIDKMKEFENEDDLVGFAAKLPECKYKSELRSFIAHSDRNPGRLF